MQPVVVQSGGCREKEGGREGRREGSGDGNETEPHAGVLPRLTLPRRCHPFVCLQRSNAADDNGLSPKARKSEEGQRSFSENAD